MSRAFVDSFSEGLDELTVKQQKSWAEVLKCLHCIGRFSIFEATANQHIAKTMTALVSRKLINVDTSCGYPWSKVTLTDRGLAFIGENE